MTPSVSRVVPYAPRFHSNSVWHWVRSHSKVNVRFMAQRKCVKRATKTQQDRAFAFPVALSSFRQLLKSISEFFAVTMHSSGNGRWWDNWSNCGNSTCQKKKSPVDREGKEGEEGEIKAEVKWANLWQKDSMDSCRMRGTDVKVDSSHVTWTLDMTVVLTKSKKDMQLNLDFNSNDSWLWMDFSP